MRDFLRLILVQPMIGNEPRQKCAVDTPGHIMARRDRQIGARIVVEADRIVETGGLRGQFTEAAHTFRTIMEPPCGTKAQGRIVARQRREFPAVAGLIKGEEDKRQARIVAKCIEQRFQFLDIARRARNIGALVRSEPFERGRIVIADMSQDESA